MIDWDDVVVYVLMLLEIEILIFYGQLVIKVCGKMFVSIGYVVGSFYVCSIFDEKVVLFEIDFVIFWQMLYYEGWVGLFVCYDSFDFDCVNIVIVCVWWDQVFVMLCKVFGDCF